MLYMFAFHLLHLCFLWIMHFRYGWVSPRIGKTDKRHMAINAFYTCAKIIFWCPLSVRFPHFQRLDGCSTSAHHILSGTYVILPRLSNHSGLCWKLLCFKLFNCACSSPPHFVNCSKNGITAATTLQLHSIFALFSLSRAGLSMRSGKEWSVLYAIWGPSEQALRATCWTTLC